MERAELAAITDLRDWLDVMEELGELKTVRGANWNLEIGALSEANY